MAKRVLIILNEILCRFGCALAIHSNQGRNYESKVFQELCELLEIRKPRTSPMNPKANGQIERFNRTLPFGKIVSDSQNIYIPSRGHWQWSQYISS
jgi:transposase InsO family protein